MTRIVNAPGRFTGTPLSLAADVARWVSVRGANAVFLTEVANHSRADVLGAAAGAGWTVNRKQGSGVDLGLGECAILTRDAHYVEILDVRWAEVWPGGGKGRFARKVYAVIVVARTATGHIDLLTGLHTKAHVEGIWAHLPMSDRIRAKVLLRKGRKPIQDYLSIVHAWRLATMQAAADFHADDVIAAPDGNLDAHKPWVPQLLHRAWPGMHLAATKAPDLGKRTVGWVLTTMTPGPSHVEKARASDHDAGVYTLARVNKTPASQPDPAKVPPPPSTRCTYNGAGMDVFTRTGVQTIERHPLGDLAPLTITQGCWNPGGVAASAGTHDRSGVIDLAPFEYGRKVKAWREALGPMWHRTAIPGLWPEHCHGVIASCDDLAPVAAAQIPEYLAGQDGLAGHAHDPNGYHPKPTFDYVSAWHAING